MPFRRFRPTVSDHINQPACSFRRLIEIILSDNRSNIFARRPIATAGATLARAKMLHTHLFHRICKIGEADGDAPCVECAFYSYTYSGRLPPPVDYIFKMKDLASYSGKSARIPA